MTRIVRLSLFSLFLAVSAAQSSEDQLQASGNNRKAVIFSDDCFLPSLDTYRPTVFPPSIGYFSESDQYFMKLGDKYMPWQLKNCKTEEDVFTLIKNHEREQEENFLSTLERNDRVKLYSKMKEIDKSFSLNGTSKLENLQNERGASIMSKYPSKLKGELGDKRTAVADVLTVLKSSIFDKVILPVAVHYGIYSNSILPLVGNTGITFIDDRLTGDCTDSETVLLPRGFIISVPQKEILKSELSFNDIAKNYSNYDHELGGHGRSGNGLKMKLAKQYSVAKNVPEYSNLRMAYEQTSDINGILNPEILTNTRSLTNEQRKMSYFGGMLCFSESMQEDFSGDKFYQDQNNNPNIKTNWNWFNSTIITKEHPTDKQKVIIGYYFHPSDAQRFMVFKRLYDILTSKQISHRLLDFQAK